MTYPTLATVNATNDLTPILVYVNNITYGLAMPLTLFAFFIITFVGGAFLQLRTKGDINWAFAFTASSFVSYGFSLLMSLENGMLNSMYSIILLAMFILGMLWMYLRSPE